MENANFKKDTVSKSWFCVFNNPEEHGYTGTPQEIVDRLCEEWTASNPSRTGAWIYCISADGLKHIHMVLEDVKAMRFSAIKKSYAIGMHFAPTKGTKEQAEDYINKRGKFEEKGEKIIASSRHGEIKGCQGHRKELEVIEELLSSGKNPREIMDMSLSYRRHEDIIVSAYRDKRRKEVGHMRKVNVVWHFGKSGSGKSYFSNSLIEKYGLDSVYFMTDYGNGCFDSYMCQPVLFMDEYRGQFPYSALLTILDEYVSEVHARYHNAPTLWNELHITSVYTPDEIFRRNVQDSSERSVETFEQLRRRINTIMYHWKDDAGFHQFPLPMSEYKDRNDIVFKAARCSDSFFLLPSGIVTPFDK